MGFFLFSKSIQIKIFLHFCLELNKKSEMFRKINDDNLKNPSFFIRSKIISVKNFCAYLFKCNT